MKGLEEEALCAYCSRPASTIEHCPPRIMFLDKDRPRGWEFPACSSCNEGTSDSDQIFSFFIFSNILNFTAEEERHFQKIAKGINNNQRHVIDEVLQNAAPIALGSILSPNVAGPVSVAMGQSLLSHIDRIADKLALSAHFIEHGVRAPTEALVWHHWITNEGAHRGEHKTLNLSFPPPRAIRQGKKSSEGQFVYQTISPQPGNGVFRFVFQKRVMLLSMMHTPPVADSAAVALDQGFRRPMTGKPTKPSLISFASANRIIRPIISKNG